MSDGKVAKLEGINKVLRFNSLFFIVGFIVLFLIPEFIQASMETIRTLNNFYTIGWIIIGLPKIWAAFTGGIGAAIFGPLRADYEVVTVDGLGRTVSSDGGAQSMQMSFLVRLLQAGLVIAIGPIIAIIHLIILSFKYVTTALTTKAKSSVVPNGFIVILVNIAVVIGSLIIAMTVQSINRAVHQANVGLVKSDGFVSVLTETKDSRMIIGFDNKSGGVTIPSRINGLPVVALDSNLDGTSDITSIVIPEGVTDIGSWAFRDSTKLTSVTLPHSILRIGESFTNCTSLTEVIIPQGHTIRYGRYLYITGGTSNATRVAVMGDSAYFQEGRHTPDGKAKTFNGCSRLSAASRQAIRDSGYDGEF